MNKLMRLLFGNGAHNIEILPQNEVHRTHNQYATELLKIQHKVKVIEREAKEIKDIIDTATRTKNRKGGDSL